MISELFMGSPLTNVNAFILVPELPASITRIYLRPGGGVLEIEPIIGCTDLDHATIPQNTTPTHTARKSDNLYVL